MAFLYFKVLQAFWCLVNAVESLKDFPQLQLKLKVVPCVFSRWFLIFPSLLNVPGQNLQANSSLDSAVYPLEDFSKTSLSSVLIGEGD